MPNSTTDDSIKLKSTNPYTLVKAKEILKQSLYNSYEQEEKFIKSNEYLKSQGKKLQILRRISNQYLRKSVSDFSIKKSYKSLALRVIRNFYKGYKLSIYTVFLFLDLKLRNRLTNFKKYFYKRKNFSKNYLQLKYPKLKKFKTFRKTLFKSIKEISREIIKIFLVLKTIFALDYKTNLHFYFSSSLLLRLFYKIDNGLKKIFHEFFKKLLQYFSFFLIDERSKFTSGKIKLGSLLLTKKLFNIKNYLLKFFLLERKQIIAFFERLVLVISIYFLPFIFLVTQALIPLIEEYEYLIINPINSHIFSRVPFLIDLIKLFLPIITNPMLLFWIPLGYYLTFSSAYRSLKISYKVAYNGTIGAIFLIINYSCFLLQFIMKLAFDFIKIIKDIFFTSYLIKHLGKNKIKERDEAIKIFANLVTRYDSGIRKNYYEFLLLINHRIFSHLALISLAALVYNCIYYIIHNRNPEIILVTKTALATIKNPQQEE
uniref:hypothetical protein Ycf60 n=1 Tax=Chlorobotrys sp. TaxID=2859677 RepID=UPI002182338E|nr:hypothetical protein Ycf60 [Chlorobotrys sp.]UVI60838.1 hypothetical protein Ycf60 [Chlorobotrys sp.]